MHTALRQIGTEAVLKVFERQSHAQFDRDGRFPEEKKAVGEMPALFQ